MFEAERPGCKFSKAQRLGTYFYKVSSHLHCLEPEKNSKIHQFMIESKLFFVSFILVETSIFIAFMCLEGKIISSSLPQTGENLKDPSVHDRIAFFFVFG